MEKAIRGNWDGSKNEDGRSGGGIVMKAVNRENWITISNIAVSLKVGTAMAAEIAGTSMLTGAQDLLLDR